MRGAAIGLWALFLFVVLLIAGAGMGFWPWAVPLSYLLLSLLTFGFYWRDKRAAMRGAWRTPERTLQLLGLMGGWPGGYLAQRLLRHKCSKRSFQVEFWMSVVGNLALQTWLFSTHGLQLLNLF